MRHDLQQAGSRRAEPDFYPLRNGGQHAQRAWRLFPRRYVCAIFDHGKNLFERMLAVSGHDGPEHADEVLAGHVATVGPFGFTKPEDDQTTVVTNTPQCLHVVDNLTIAVNLVTPARTHNGKHTLMTNVCQ